MIQEIIASKLELWAIDRLGLKESPKGWLRGDCPECGRNNTFGINVESNRINCFVCGLRGTPLKLYSLVNRLDNYRDAINSLKTEETGRLIRRKKVETREVKPKDLTFPKGYNNILTGSGIIAQSARNYLKQRGYDIYDLALRGIGYGTEDLLGFIIFPYISEGKLKYYTCRKYIGDKAFKNPEESEVGVGKSDLIYNEDCLKIYKEVNIVESITNALTLDDNTIALGGKAISPKQLNILIKSGVENFNILLDPDAIEESYKLSLKLASYRMVRNVRWQGNYDVNNLGKKVTKYLIKRTPLMSYKELYNKYLSATQ